jgi:hypothetical protein
MIRKTSGAAMAPLFIAIVPELCALVRARLSAGG